MAKYQQYESVLLKDGRIATIVEVYEPGAYDADIGDSPKIGRRFMVSQMMRLSGKRPNRRWIGSTGNPCGS